MEKLGRKLNGEYAGLQGSYWMMYCMVLSFASVFLQAAGYSGAEIGVIMAASNVMALIIQPPMAALADKSKKISLAHILWALCGVTVVILVIICFVSVRSAVLSVCYTAAFALSIVIQPFMTSLTLQAEEQGIHINYGACRAIGSLAYAVLAAVMGTVVEKLGAGVVPISALIVAGLFMAFLAMFTVGISRSGEPVKPASAKTEKPGGSMAFFKNNKRFTVFLLGIAFLFATHSLINNFMIYIVQNVGGGSGDMGRLCGFMALMEMPAMILFDRLTQKFSCSTLLKFSIVMFTVKAVALYLAPGIPWLYAALILQGVSFAIYIPASVRYAMLVVDSGDAVKAQAFVSLTGTLGSIFASLIGGVLFDVSGAGVTLLVGAVISAVGTVIAFPAVAQTGCTER